MMILVELWLLINIDMCFSYLISKKKRINDAYVDWNQKTKCMEFFDRLKKIVTENKNKVRIRNLWENGRRYFDLKNDKNNNVIVVEY